MGDTDLDQVSMGDFLTKRKEGKKVKPVAHPQATPEIDHDVPVPVELRGGSRNFSHFYPFEEMAVGDSFWVQADSNCTSGACSKFAKKTGWGFVTRSQTKDGKRNRKRNGTGRNGTRVWRVR